MKMIIRLSTIFLFIAILFSCKQQGVVNTNTPTSGSITIGGDESFKLLADAEVYTFKSLYAKANVTIEYKSELDLLTDFLNDSISAMITARKLTSKEESFLKNKNIIARTVLIARDAVVFITNKENNKLTLTYKQLNDLFTGKINSWHEIDSRFKPLPLTIVFDNKKSANARFINERFELKNQFPPTCSAVNTNEEVVNFVSKNKNAIGIISANWISDPQDTVSNSFLNRVSVVAIGGELNTDEFYLPYQGYIAERTYPFIRNIYYINRESYSGLATGFSSFLANEKGQRIVLRSGLVPATMPLRIIELKK